VPSPAAKTIAFMVFSLDKRRSSKHNSYETSFMAPKSTLALVLLLQLGGGR